MTRRTRQSHDRVDCFVAPAIILRPKAARDKVVGAVLCIDTRRIAKSVRVAHVTISLCGVHARACVSRCRYYLQELIHSMRSRSIRPRPILSANSEGDLARYRQVVRARSASDAN